MAIEVDFSHTVKRVAKTPGMTWSDEQEAIFTWFEKGKGNLVVRARAGTGKTTTILEGVNRAPEAKILLAAFNKSIANELQAKLKNPRVEAKTLHGLGFAFLRRVWNGVRVDDTKRAEGLARRAAPSAPDPMLRLIKLLHTKAREVHPFATLDDVIDLAVRFDLLPDEQWERDGWDVRTVAAAVLRAMEFAKERTDTIDFADMIFLPLVLDLVRPWFDLVVVDEAQDMTVAQLMLATGACKKGGRVVVVGDDRQAIYAFRGADSGSLDRLKNELSATELGLKTTYRCPQQVVALARMLVQDYVAAPTAPEGSVKSILEDAMTEVVSEGDFILSRTNAPLVHLCLELLKRGRRARIKGRDIGKGIIALIRRMQASSPEALVAKTQAWANRECTKAQALGDAAEKRINLVRDQESLIVALAEGVATIAEVVARAETLFADDAERGAIMLSTVHRAKGLEAHRVFLLQETFRSGRLEEDNIRYVGITRAKSELIWVR